MRRNPTITGFQLRPTARDYGFLVESLATRMPNDRARIHNHYMVTHAVDAKPPTNLHFASTKPNAGTFTKEALHKDAAKRKFFLLDPLGRGGSQGGSWPKRHFQKRLKIDEHQCGANILQSRPMIGAVFAFKVFGCHHKV